MSNTVTNTRPATEKEKQVFMYLNELRKSGETNMFGAAPYIADKFPELTLKEARGLLGMWMTVYNAEDNYENTRIILPS